MKKLSGSTCASLLSLACATTLLALPSDTVVVQWNDAALQAIRITHPGPPIVARALAITNTCMYDAWAPYDEHALGTRLGDTLRVHKQHRKDSLRAEAMSFAAYRCLSDLFPLAPQTDLLKQLMTTLGYNPNNASADVSTPAGVGNVTSQAVLAFRHTDGSNQLGTPPYSDYTGYMPTPNNPDHWQPLSVLGGPPQKYIAPHWGLVTPFALTSGSQFRPASGPAKSTDPLYKTQADQVLAYSAALDDRMKTIAEYWADGPASELPPGHWCLFAEFVSRRDHHSLSQDVKMFFGMTNAIFDASIAAWDTKRFYDSVRPVTAIHYLYDGKPVFAYSIDDHIAKIIDGGVWKPYQARTVVTPPFPEYYSGHSIFSAAGAQILKVFTGSDTFGGSVTVLAGSSRVEPGLVPATNINLSWQTFSDAADEAGISRRYGGIHFQQGDLDARFRGRLIADQAWQKALVLFNGSVD